MKPLLTLLLALCLAHTARAAPDAQAILAAPGSPLSLWISPDLDSTAGGKTCVGTRLPVSLSNATAASKTWLQGRWQGSTTYTRNPRSKAVFGLHRGADKVIQVREVY